MLAVLLNGLLGDRVSMTAAVPSALEGDSVGAAGESGVAVTVGALLSQDSWTARVSLSPPTAT